MEKKIASLEPFFIYPNANLHIREVAKMTKVSHTAVGKHLKQLERDGYLIKKPTKPYSTYKANTASKKYLNLKLYYNLEKIMGSGIIEELEKKYDYPVIVLFGSFAKAMDDENSDIDICIISEVKSTFDVKPYESITERPISLHIFNKKKWQEAKKKNTNLINSICNGIVVSGQLEVLWQDLDKALSKVMLK